MNGTDGIGKPHDCNCHDKLNQTIAHYLGATLIVAVVSILYMGVSGRARDTALTPALATFDRIATAVVAGVLTMWGAKPKGNSDGTITGGQKGPGSKVEVTEEEKKDA